MKLLYLDESYDTKYYCAGGMIIDDTKIRKFEEKINKIIKKNNIPDDTEIHGDMMWNKRCSPWDSIGTDGVRKILDELVIFLSEYKGPKFIIALVQKSSSDQYVSLLQKIYPEAKKSLNSAGSSNKQLLVVFDERQDINQDIFDSIKTFKDIVDKSKSNHAIVDYGYEGKSKFSRYLQTVDLVLYFYRKYYQLKRNPDLFGAADDARLIAMLDDMFEVKLKKKIKVILV